MHFRWIEWAGQLGWQNQAVFTAEQRKSQDRVSLWAKSTFSLVGLFVPPISLGTLKQVLLKSANVCLHGMGHQNYIATRECTVHMAVNVRILKNRSSCNIGHKLLGLS